MEVEEAVAIMADFRPEIAEPLDKLVALAAAGLRRREQKGLRRRRPLRRRPSAARVSAKCLDLGPWSAATLRLGDWISRVTEEHRRRRLAYQAMRSRSRRTPATRGSSRCWPRNSPNPG